jgi:hypothetical protein
MFHLAAYFKSVDTTVNADITALTDSVLTISNNHFRLVDNMQLVGAAAMSATLIRARLDSPTLRIVGNPYILPSNTGVTPVAESRMANLYRYPYPMPPREELAMQATANPGTTENFTGLVWLSLGAVPIPPGRVQWVRITSTTAAVANAWTNIALTFETSLPSGYYSVIGSRAWSTNGQAHRLIFPGQVWRPGYLSKVAAGNQDPPPNYNGDFGELGRFVNDNPFQCEVLCNGTDNSHNLYVGLVPVGSL